MFIVHKKYNYKQPIPVDKELNPHDSSYVSFTNLITRSKTIQVHSFKTKHGNNSSTSFTAYSTLQPIQLPI